MGRIFCTSNLRKVKIKCFAPQHFGVSTVVIVGLPNTVKRDPRGARKVLILQHEKVPSSIMGIPVANVC